MTVKPLALLLALSSPWACVAETRAFAGGDLIELRPSDEAGVQFEVFYNNGMSMSSQPGTFLLEMNGVQVRVEITIGGMDRNQMETIQVEVLDDGLIAVPAEADVVDGETATIRVMLPMM